MANINFPNDPTENQIFTVGGKSYKWDGVKWVFVPQEAGIDVSDADALVSDVLEGKTFYAGEDPELKTGNIPSKNAENFTPGTSNQTISSGQYLSGDQTVQGDANLTVGNIKAGTSIFGINGNFTADATAIAGDILSGKTTYVNGNKVTGTMTNRGNISQSLGINGTYTIPAGFHSGSGTVSQSVATRGASTITPGTSNQTIAANRWLTGTQTILGSANLAPNNIKQGVNIFGVNGTLIPDLGAIPTSGNASNPSSLPWVGRNGRTTSAASPFPVGDRYFTNNNSFLLPNYPQYMNLFGPQPSQVSEDLMPDESYFLDNNLNVFGQTFALRYQGNIPHTTNSCATAGHVTFYFSDGTAFRVVGSGGNRSGCGSGCGNVSLPCTWSSATWNGTNILRFSSGTNFTMEQTSNLQFRVNGTIYKTGGKLIQVNFYAGYTGTSSSSNSIYIMNGTIDNFVGTGAP